MDYYNSSPSSCSSTKFPNINYPFNPLIDHQNVFDVNGGLVSGGSFYTLPVESVENVGGYGVMETYGMGLENDLSVPGLEVRGVDHVHDHHHHQSNYGVSDYGLDKKNNISGNINNNNNQCFDDNNNGGGERIKVEEFVGVGNNWQGESFKMGELDWEGLLANVSSLPYLDFQVE